MGQENIADLVSPSSFSIEFLTDRYRLQNVSYDGRASVVDIREELLDHGTFHRQKEWVALTRKGPWRVPAGPLYHAVCSALHANRKHPDKSQKTLISTLKNMLATDVRTHGVMTSTRVHYAPHDQDTIIHDVGYKNESRIYQNIVGSNGYVTKAGDFDNAIEALLGVRGCGNVQAVYSWLFGTKPSLSRFNQKPRQDEERALVLDDNTFRIVAYDRDIYRPARGMVVRGVENSTGNTR